MIENWSRGVSFVSIEKFGPPKLKTELDLERICDVQTCFVNRTFLYYVYNKLQIEYYN